MRLINAQTLEVHEFLGDDVPNYYILSHRWSHDELAYKDFVKGRKTGSLGFRNVLAFCKFAVEWHCGRDSIPNSPCYVWIDTCCIDKRSSAELSEAINSMYTYSWRADVCFAYLVDVEAIPLVTAKKCNGSLSGAAYGPGDTPERMTGQDDDQFTRSTWFTRGWTLQELLAPRVVVFLNRDWQVLGSKQDSLSTAETSIINLNSIIARTTGINDTNLRTRGLVFTASIAQRMSWAADRHTIRSEDIAYSLLVLFSVNLPLLYGEGGKRAFTRLQEELIRKSTDQSILAWSPTLENCRRVGLHITQFTSRILALSLANFRDAGDIVLQQRTKSRMRPYAITNAGLELDGRVRRAQGLSANECGEDDGELMVFALGLNCVYEEDAFMSSEDPSLEDKLPVSIYICGPEAQGSAEHDGDVLFGFSRLHFVHDTIRRGKHEEFKRSSPDLNGLTCVERDFKSQEGVPYEHKTFYLYSGSGAWEAVHG